MKMSGWSTPPFLYPKSRPPKDKSGNDSEVNGYQFGCIGMSGRHVTVQGQSGTRFASQSPVEGEYANPFFVEYYRNTARELFGFHAREHTAQVPLQTRIEREERLREGTLPILFCSPTMELGVDIKQLNAVNLRNIPPTPANYAPTERTSREEWPNRSGFFILGGGKSA